MSRSIPLGRIFGIRLLVHPSWFAVLLLLAFGLSNFYFGWRFPRWPAPLVWAAGVSGSLAFFVGVLLHELAHSLVAQRHGIPVRSITLFLFGGVSHISADAPTPGVELKIALAGPLSSLVLALLLFVTSGLAGGERHPIGGLLLLLATLNLSLGIFNLLPGFPLDGGRLFRSMVWFASDDFGWATRVATVSGQLAAGAFIAAGLYLAFGVHSMTPSGLWLAFVGWFLFKSAGDNLQGTMLMRRLDGLRVTDILRPEPSVVEERAAALEVAHAMLQDPRHDLWIVTRAGEVVGLVGHRDLRRAGVARLRSVAVSQVMRRLTAGQLLDAQTPAAQALQLILESRQDALPVMAGGVLAGLLYRDDLLRVLELRHQLGK
ncbi:MAG: site-2 protease family protein [Chloroflexi bacterium]|nr:site-2 protease family protein [Chloroflexota bacterium]